MKKLFLFGLMLLLFSCSEDERQLELFSPDAFAFEMENGWELNASVQVKGFDLKETGSGKFNSHLTYFINIATPSADTIKEADFGEIEKSYDEEISDLPLDFQIEFDSTFSPGKYTMQIFVTDMLSGRKTSTLQNFLLEKY